MNSHLTALVELRAAVWSRSDLVGLDISNLVKNAVSAIAHPETAREFEQRLSDALLALDLSATLEEDAARCRTEALDVLNEIRSASKDR